ncbi:hypothetical protein D7223_23595 [Micromonospora endolithica]|uniref:LPXTG cell wall anchor domain-containing protein n=1 Tax=Micromonospora endolithica TaxID=230091 RepID=A0A3A9Z4B8_9ACTN|nr:hypothetical protein D7223_23595 [Micromonospora endolithica]
MLGALVLIGALTLVGAAPARAGENTFVEVTPNPAQAGTRVSIRASCDNANNRQETVHSDAFGRVVVRPDNGFLTGQVTVPGSKEPGDYQVELRCDNNTGNSGNGNNNGNNNGNTATTTFTVLNMAQPSKGPATGGGGTAGAAGPGSLLLIGGFAAVALAVGFGFFGGRRRTGAGS